MTNQHYTTCCKKEVQWEEYLVNHGMCNTCMDELVEFSNKKQLEIFTEGYVTKDNNDQFSIIRDVFITEGNTGWTYETLASGFITEEEAESYLQSLLNKDDNQ